jgi:type VI secretion system protein ImpF
MANPLAHESLVPSLLDRLLDDDPATTRETPKARTQVLRELKQSVRRDLECLLNTRWRCRGWPEDLDQLELSILNYGLPDLIEVDLQSTAGRGQFQRILEKVIRYFEPRFKSVRVEVLKNASLLDHTVRFRIDAVLYAEPAPEPVVFDSSLEPATGNVEVRGTRT